MKKELLTVFLILATIVANGASPNALRKADSAVDIVDNDTVTIDTLLYAIGNQYTIASMAEENHLMCSENDLKDYIRGLEDYFLSDNAAINDSSYIMSYNLGVILGGTRFMTGQEKN